MARSRNIKPGFFKNDQLAELDPLTRLLFAGLWTLADREGRLQDRPKRIKAELLPYDDCDVDAMLDSLSSGPDPFIIRYEAEGDHLIQVVNWKRHQKPHHQESESEFAPIPKDFVPRCEEVRKDFGCNRSDSLSLDSLNTDSLNPLDPNGSMSPNGDSPSENPPSEAAFIAAWNSTSGVTRVREMTKKRRVALRQRLATKGWWSEFLEALKMFPLPFVESGESKGWVPDCEWILKPDSVTKILEGKYHRANQARGDPRGTGSVVTGYIAKLRQEKPSG